ncbi:DUF2256 domain-containing protein [Acinetobacter johnsonii]
MILKNCPDFTAIRPFTWLKKWYRCWEEVRYRSERC